MAEIINTTCYTGLSAQKKKESTEEIHSERRGVEGMDGVCVWNYSYYATNDTA